MKKQYNTERHPVDLEAGFAQLKARIERRQHNRKLKMIWWAVLLAVLGISAMLMRQWF